MVSASLRLEADLEAVAEQPEGRERCDRRADRVGGDRGDDPGAGGEERNRDQQRERGSGALDHDVGKRPVLHPDRDRAEPDDRPEAAGDTRPDDQLGVGALEQEVGDRVREDQEERRPDDRDQAGEDDPGPERSLPRLRGVVVIVVVAVIVVVIAAEDPLQRPLLGAEVEEEAEQPGGEQEQPVSAELGRPEEDRDDDGADQGERVVDEQADGVDRGEAQHLLPERRAAAACRRLAVVPVVAPAAAHFARAS